MVTKWEDIIKIEKHHQRSGMDFWYVMWKEEDFQVQASGGFVSEYQAEVWIEENFDNLKVQYDSWIDAIILRGPLE